MAIAHYAALKTATWVFGLVGAAIFVMEPTVKVALIVALPLTITSVGNFILGVLNRAGQKRSQAQGERIQESVDGNFSKLWEKQQSQSEKLHISEGKLSHAEGRREGVEATEDKGRENHSQ